MTRGTVVRLEDLLGRKVVAANGRRVGHIEEVCVERHNGEYQVVEYLLGSGALLERWSFSQSPLGRPRPKLVARWDQMDISTPERPRLTCSVKDLERVDV